MKYLFILLSFCHSISIAAQETTGFDGKNWKAPYFLNEPPHWEVERFLIPVAFAPSIPYKGVEDIRFTPGWSKKETNDYWSYAFLWYLDSIQTFNPELIQKNLAAYYTGLASINVDEKKLGKTLPAATVFIKNKKAENGDVQTFEGRVAFTDFLTVEPLTLNLIVHVRYCEGQDKTFVFHELSPRPYNDAVWKSLDQLWLHFTCIK